MSDNSRFIGKGEYVGPSPLGPDWSKENWKVAPTTEPDTDQSAPCMPVDLPALRNELVAKWQTPSWQIAEMESEQRAMALLKYSGHDVKGLDTRGAQVQAKVMSEAELFWVGREMCDLLFTTAPSVPEDVTPENLVWPAKSGFVVLAKSWDGLDSRDMENSVVVDAVTWARLPTTGPSGVTRDALNISFYRCIRWSNGLSPVELTLAQSMDLQSTAKKTTAIIDGNLAIVPTGQAWMPLGRSTWPMGSPLYSDEEVRANLAAHGVPAKAVIGWEPKPDQPDAQPPEGWEIGTIHADEEAIENEVRSYVQSMIEDRKFISAFFTLLNTHSLAQEVVEYPSRAAMRREQRESGRTEPSTVRVVYLRRPAHHGDHTPTKQTVNWSHRWIVNAHWRNQPYGPGRSQRRLTLIPSHVKGPDDLPVVVKTTVKAWVR